ncbi:MAG: spore coat protein CotH [Bacteroidales bacterium]|nr:spore coat protein CotH [Bacteroidales bacterium]
MKHIKTIFLSIFAAVAVSCSGIIMDNIVQDPSDKELLNFSIEQERNPRLKASVTGEIEGDSIKLSLPQAISDESLVATFTHNGARVFVGDVEQESGVTANDFTKPLVYTVMAQDESTQSYTVVVNWIPEEVVKELLPHIYIDIENGEAMETRDKKRELNAVMKVEGKQNYPNYEGDCTIRGRGNSTWGMPKQPYRIKLKEAASLMGLAAYKDWVLLNEYLDGTMLYNSVPFKAGQLLGIPYTNTVVPVELTINGEYRGVYAFTEHKEVGVGRIDIGDDGLLLELDVYYDEDWKFKSTPSNLPVMIQFPKSKNMNEQLLQAIEDDFNNLDRLVQDSSFPDNEYLDYFDDLSFVNYMIVYELTKNGEINHPKSTYINKPAGGKYRMGIIWDFDWGYGYGYRSTHFDLAMASESLFWGPGGEGLGTWFFERLMSDPHMRSLFKERWEWFKAEKMGLLKDYVIEYAEAVSQALADDHTVWGHRNATSNPQTNLQRLLDWLDARAAYIDGAY